ncbi:norsolorinic acid reductase [Aspergillus japonicus CBS 114.51]|uniref:Norsolorinic acid reductase n=2 Tax=Aspergillus TaxID=5052 RepID=A0A2V5GZY2_ASPV1|nr:norsolorinic acid reductase [Aspergillus japonicus CBS 114.51]PYI14864.1 norsolorinic acid reductase [Aspergillus violaceofuscus CBS 115571]RAH84764.1 norsolorinic acid reductase [Aspergillus japonicus CBS 114.51]
MSFNPVAPKPKSLLGYHQVLSPTAGVKVSPLCLGAMNFGEAWTEFMGKCSKEDTFALLDYFFNEGGNFIDTANAYQYEESETWIGEWMKLRNNRDQMVIATKYTTGYRTAHLDTEPLQSNFVGNSVKSLRVSVDASLRKLQTDYIDLLYVHWWDFTTGVEEVMQGLNALVTAGKVLYLGVSDTPAWVVVKANDYARAHGLRPFAVYQGKWNAGFRDMEREIVPMCRDQGMAIAPWAPLGQGRFRSAAARQQAQQHEGSTRGSQPTEADLKISEVLEKVAERKGTNLYAIALAYLRYKQPYIYPIVGQRKVEHLKANIDALKIDLSKAEIREIDLAAPFDPGFPNTMLFGGNEKYDVGFTAADISLTKWAAHIDAPAQQEAVRPRKE